MRATTKLGQVELKFRTWGGKRKGAGRKRTGKKRVDHRRRAELAPRFPTHVTLRFIDGLPTMRRRDSYRAIRQAMYVVMPRTDFRIVHLSIQKNHVHMICEAAGRQALSRGIQA